MCHFVGSRFNYIPLEMPLVTVYLLISKNSHGSFWSQAKRASACKEELEKITTFSFCTHALEINPKVKFYGSKGQPLISLSSWGKKRNKPWCCCWPFCHQLIYEVIFWLLSQWHLHSTSYIKVNHLSFFISMGPGSCLLLVFHFVGRYFTV